MPRLFYGIVLKMSMKLSDFNDINIPDSLPAFARKAAVFSNDFSGHPGSVLVAIAHLWADWVWHLKTCFVCVRGMRDIGYL